MAENEPITTFSSLDREVVQEIQQLLCEHRKIQAIKLYRENQNVGLKEAKDAIDKEFDFLIQHNPILREEEQKQSFWKRLFLR